MNKYKVTKLALGYKEKKKCATCNKSINGKKKLAAYYVEQLNNPSYWEGPDDATHITCSEECATSYMLQHMDDPPTQTPFEKFVVPRIKQIWPNLLSSEEEVKR
jgi:hypothetical protein